MRRVWRELLPESVRERIAWVTGRHPDRLLSEEQRRANKAKLLCSKGEFQAVAQTKFGAIWVDLRDHGVGYPLYVKRSYEPIETAFVQNFLRSGDVFVDVGANLGYFTRVALSVVGASGRILAFEPDPHNYSLFCRNAADNLDKQVSGFNCGLGDSEFSAVLSQSSYNFGDHRISSTPLIDSAQQCQVRITTLNAKIAELAVSEVSLVKIDTQGFEVPVLRGMSNVFAQENAPAVIMEFWPFGIRKQDCAPAEVFQIAEKYGMSVFLLEEGKAKLNCVEEAEQHADKAHSDDLGKYVNLVLLPENRKDRFFGERCS
jgi:FkbM family methyltransferase